MTTRTKEELISVREAAQECGRNTETVRRWIWGGKLPAQKLGNQLYIKRSDFTSFCRETAIRKYQAEPKPDFLERAIALRNKMKARGVEPIDAGELIRQMREERMNELEQRLSEGETNMKAESRASLIKRMRKLGEEIHARTDEVFDAETMIRELRDERDREVS